MKPKYKVGDYVTWKTLSNKDVVILIVDKTTEYSIKYIINSDYPTTLGKVYNFEFGGIDTESELITQEQFNKLKLENL